MAPMLSALGAGRRRPWKLVVASRAPSKQLPAWIRSGSCERWGKPRTVARLAPPGGELKQDGGRARAIHSPLTPDAEA